MAEAEDDHALFLAHGFLEMDAEAYNGKVPSSSFYAKNADLDLHEPKASAFLDIGSGVSDKLDGWYLDSGATHHMTGCRELFTDLDTTARGTVRFGDESKVSAPSSSRRRTASTGCFMVCTTSPLSGS